MTVRNLAFVLMLAILAGLSFAPSKAKAQSPQACQWNYGFDASGNAVASYCGNVAISSQNLIMNLGSGHVFGNGTSSSALGSDTELLTVMQQSGSGLNLGAVNALANALNASGGLLSYGIIGTSGATVGLLNTDNIVSGKWAFAAPLYYPSTIAPFDIGLGGTGLTGCADLGYGNAQANSESCRYTTGANSTHSRALSATSAINNSDGSGTDGPQNADIAEWFSSGKNNYLTSTVHGERDGTLTTTWQGIYGDTSVALGRATKAWFAPTCASDATTEGGVEGSEQDAQWVNQSGYMQWFMVDISAFGETCGSVSNRMGYGHWVESQFGTAYAGYYASTYGSPNTSSITSGGISGITLTVTTYTGAPLVIGSAISGTGVTAGTKVTALGTGVGGAGTYTVNNSQTVSFTAGSPGTVIPPYGFEYAFAAGTNRNSSQVYFRVAGDQIASFDSNLTPGSIVIGNLSGYGYQKSIVVNSSNYIAIYNSAENAVLFSLSDTGAPQMPGLPTSAAGGGLYVCVDALGNFYKKVSCP